MEEKVKCPRCGKTAIKSYKIVDGKIQVTIVCRARNPCGFINKHFKQKI